MTFKYLSYHWNRLSASKNGNFPITLKTDTERIYLENKELIIKSDKYYDNESVTVQHKNNKLNIDKMNEIYKIIEENKNSYTLENREVNGKLNELSNFIFTKKKRNSKNVEFIFKNDIRPNIQPFNFTSFSNTLSLISLGFKVYYGNAYGSNYNYSSNAGEDIDIYFLGKGL
ncbi:hypothetical protein BCR32DRAFT_278868 [Anaeromyces robustus]|uniref:Uncharacterized protein n=1 Tax=Anaeromyces robustus TaxID=1754192 RepID=A0A1Y1X9T0_9FUNG|nr:hypothetical protein BCR32DRAFT_278868 [Anaeromyces robustus]|eukprot:ORX82479.1 hypothetical protein BCR32DRAFT_278868 [Anaeromyces robustus]